MLNMILVYAVEHDPNNAENIYARTKLSSGVL